MLASICLSGLTRKVQLSASRSTNEVSLGRLSRSDILGPANSISTVTYGRGSRPATELGCDYLFGCDGAVVPRPNGSFSIRALRLPQVLRERDEN